MNYQVKRVSRHHCEFFIKKIHYAKRWCSISYAFGLFRDNDLVGIVTYGTPPSSTLRTGIAGVDNQDKVLELNRLVLQDNLKNEASMLVGRSLKLLPKPSIIISFADSSMNHHGYVYQACNFTYHGLSEKRTDWNIEGSDKHNTTLTDEFRGVKNRTHLARERYGDKFSLTERPRKHRYVYITGNKTDVKRLRADINYKQKDYPKGDNKRYTVDLGNDLDI